MRNIITILFASLFAFSVANADYIVGVKGAYVQIDASGTESDKDGTADTSTRTKSVDNDAFIASLYTEYSMDAGYASEGNGFTFGFEYTPGSADVSDKTFKRTDATTDANETTQDDGERTANAEVENYMNLYLEMPLYSSMYLRAGMAQIDVNTLETNLSTSSGAYGNDTLDGLNLGIGFKGVSSNTTWKLAYEQTDFDTLNLNSTTSDKGNKITADLDTQELNFSLGYKF